MKFSWKEYYRAFRAWQQKPYTVDPMSDEPHECATCHTQFTGNFCPRCGQSYKIGRYSFKNAFLMFLDVWGLGNRGMFLTLRDLLLRPGYMIRDYLSGMQMAYYPPFTMFFLLTALSLLISHGFNVNGEHTSEEAQEALHKGFETATISHEEEPLKMEISGLDQQKQEKWNVVMKRAFGVIDQVVRFQEAYPNLFSLALLVLFSGFFYIFFRKCPAIPDLRYSEFIVAMVYISNMLSVYSAFCDFFCLHDGIELLCWLSTVVAFRQLSGFTWWRTIWSLTLAGLLITLFSFLAIVAFFFIIMADVL